MTARTLELGWSTVGAGTPPKSTPSMASSVLPRAAVMMTSVPPSWVPLEGASTPHSGAPSPR